jgi:DNA-binding GntR family transcriptional regulator
VAVGGEIAKRGAQASAEGSPDGAAPRQRLRPGELRARVLEFLRARPGEEFSPTAVARALDASAGAVNNALERLVETGEAVLKADSPQRFSAASKRW